MPYSDRAVSPCVYTPGAGEMTLEKTAVAQFSLDRLSIAAGNLSQIALNNFVPVRVSNVYTHSAGAHYGSEALHIFRTSAGSWLYVFAYGILRSTDNRVTWTLVRSGNNRGPFTQLSSGRILAWSSYSDDDGATWVTFSKTQGVCSAGPRQSPVTGTIIGGCSRDTAKFILIRSTDNAASWSYVYVTDNVINNYYDPYYVFCSSNGTWFCGTQCAGVYRSTDDGATWAYVNCGSLSAVFAIQEHSDGRIFAIGPYRLWVSSDSGASWSECKYDATVFRGGTFAKFLGNYGILVGNMAGNPAFAWVRRINLTTYALDIPGSIAVGGGLMTGNGENIACFNWTFEYNGIIYCPFITDRYTVGFFEVEPSAAISAETTVANAFQPTSPAKLASLPSAILTLDTTGAAGTVALYLQHYNDEVARWESYEGVANDDTDESFTLIGSYDQITNNISLPTLPARAGEKVRCRLKFTSTDGTAPAPSFVSLSLSWTSDVTAPDAPTISKIISAATADSVPGYRADFNALPAGARHLILEGQLNSGGWLPFSQRAKFENGQGYMKFRGDVAQIEAAGERNESHISAAKGLALGDVVQVRIAAEDDVGNRSSFEPSEALTIAPAVAAVTPALSIEDATLSTGATGTIRVHLHGPTTETVTVDYASADDTATDPSDYEGISGTLTFTADDGDPHQYVDIAINATGDNPTPGTTAYNVVLSNASGASVDKATGVVSVQALDYVPVLVDSFTVEVSEREEIQVEVS